MRLFVAEDEPPARQRIEQAIGRVAPDARIVGQADSVRGTADWLAANPAPDLLLLDIQLADGLSLELFEGGAHRIPVVFTTAYDRFALAAFKSLAVDYLLKPVGDAALAAALARVQALRQHFAPDPSGLAAAMDGWRAGGARERLVGHIGGRFHVLPVERLAYVVSLDKASIGIAVDGMRIGLEQTLSELEGLLDPRRFFRASRALLVSAQAVRSFVPAGRGRLQLQLVPEPGFEVVVSQERAAAFRDWLAR